ncbi:hypothetical protein AAKU55_004925 [Oxalobacteraceae bacterium GrIS 1.11]
MREFEARMDNWRRVVLGNGSGASGAACAAWAKWYVALRVSEPAPALDRLEERIKPLRSLVTADQIDGWMIEAAWRLLGDFNDRQALKFLYVHQWPEDKIRRHLVGVRGRHVPLVVARAKNNLATILKRLECADTIASVICLPGCPVPTVQPTLP